MENRKNVIYLTVDALRPDFLGCYGNDSVLTTEIDRLAEDGILFENVISTAPWTVPSVASHLTGRYAHRMNIFSSDFDLNEEPVETVFESFKKAGYETAAYIDSENLYKQWDKDVDHYSKSLDILDLLSFISDNSDEPFFIYNLYRGTHLPYVLKYSKEAWYRAQEEGLDKLRSGEEEDLEEMKHRYENAIEHFSEWYLRAIIDRLKKEDLLENTAIIITADHGETWCERRDDRSDMDAFDLHGPSLYNEVLKVPLIMYNLGDVSGKQVSQTIRSTEILPTLFEALDLDSVNVTTLDGTSLAPVLNGNADQVEFPEVAYSATTDYENPDERDLSVISKFSVVRDDWKLIWDPNVDDIELYDLDQDPEEQNDISESHPETVRELQTLLEEEMENVGSLDHDDESENVRERLEDLGYL